MEDKRQKLNYLKNRFEELKIITTKGFQTSKELQIFKMNNIKIFEEYYDLGEQIQELELELMTPEERKVEEELVAKMKIKRDGKL